MVYGIFAQGILAWSGYEHQNQKFSDRRERLNIYKNENQDLINETLFKVRQIANDYNVKNATFILYLTLHVLNKANVIVGVRSRSHIESILKLDDLKVKDTDFQYSIKLFKDLGRNLNLTNR